MKKSLFILLILSLCVFINVASLAANVGDGFISSKSINSQYFKIYMEHGVDEQTLAMRISTPSSIRAIVRRTAPRTLDMPSQFDILYLAVSEIMDIHLHTFECTVKVCRDADSLSRVAENLFGSRIKAGGFYVTAINTIYVDAENVNIHVLGHELSHAIQTQYFVVPPPATIQEVLAGFVEYQLRKYTDSLP
ncbi:MAG: hypothetical protein JW800_05040 [Candidatus Omnitrophica bacterium]|nr:hypothetical protein [Candidatus Omnitrophota bacterium]